MLTTIILFILVLGILILVHELGHFVTARMFGVKAEEFGFGYPPRIIGWVKDDEGKRKIIGHKTDSADFHRTVWSLNWLPLGGFVRIKGEDGGNAEDQDSFGSRPIWQRFIMLFAGVFMNFFLCFVILSAGYMSGAPDIVDDSVGANVNVKNAKVQIISVLPDSPASIAGVESGDEIKMIAGELIESVEETQEVIGRQGESETSFTFIRHGEEVDMIIAPKIEGQGVPARIGVGLVKTGIISYPWYEAIYRGFLSTINMTVGIVVAFGKIIGDLFTSGKVSTDVAGPIGIAVITGQVARMGWVYVLQFAALLSINLAIINLLPIPALDGGRILFLIIEALKGKKVNQKLEGAIHQIGFILLMILMALVVFRDFQHYIF